MRGPYTGFPTSLLTGHCRHSGMPSYPQLQVLPSTACHQSWSSCPPTLLRCEVRASSESASRARCELCCLGSGPGWRGA